MQSFDPRQPDILEWISSLKPEAELVVHMAMREVYQHCPKDGASRRRIDELMAECERPGRAFWLSVTRRSGYRPQR